MNKMNFRMIGEGLNAVSPAEEDIKDFSSRYVIVQRNVTNYHRYIIPCSAGNLSVNTLHVLFLCATAAPWCSVTGCLTPFVHQISFHISFHCGGNAVDSLPVMSTCCGCACVWAGVQNWQKHLLRCQWAHWCYYVFYILIGQFAAASGRYFGASVLSSMSPVVDRKMLKGVKATFGWIFGHVPLDQ